jgi:hypothetical protein
MARSAHAQPTRRVDSIVEQAAVMRREHREAEALALLLEVYRLDPTLDHAAFVGSTARAARQWSVAARYLRLALTNGALNAQSRQRLEGALRESEAHLGRLSLSCDQQGAQVSLDDGSFIPLPPEPLEVETGLHLVTFRAGPRGLDRQVRVEPGRTASVSCVGIASAATSRPAPATAATTAPQPPRAPSPSPIAPLPERSPTSPSATRVPGLGWLMLSFGAGMSGRSWHAPVVGESIARGYENGAFWELRGEVTVLIRWADQRAGAGIEARVAHPIDLESQGRRDSRGEPVTVATDASEFSLGAVVAYRPATGGLLRAQVGVLSHQFSVETASLPPEQRLPVMSYVGLRATGDGQLALIARPEWEFGFLFGGELRVVAVGADARNAFGTNPDTTFAFGASLGLYGRLDGLLPGLGVRLSGEFVNYRTAFAGPALIGPVSDSIDEYMRFCGVFSYTIGASRAVVASAVAATAR